MKPPSVFVSCCFLLAFAATNALGGQTPPGPRLESETQAVDAQRPRPALDIPPLRLAIPVLDPGLPENPAVWNDRGIWPQLRRAECVRSAYKLAEAIQALGHFDSIIVAPDRTASADLYLLGQLADSNGEDLKIQYQLLDSTGKTWIPTKTAKYRVPVGWHENNTDPLADPFAPLYAAVAMDVEKNLAAEAKKHAATVKRNKKRAAQGKSPKLSNLEKTALTKDLVLARYFAPDLYGDYLKESNGRLRLRYVPSMEDEDWARMASVGARDQAFSARLSDDYIAFADEMQDSYALWQKASYPIAREQRMLRGRATSRAIFGVLAALATIGAAVEGDVGATPTVIAGVASAALLGSSFQTNQQRRDQLRKLNELGRSLQAELAPSVVQLRETTVTLRGTAREQFRQWRDLLQELYANGAEDLEAVTVIGTETST